MKSSFCPSGDHSGWHAPSGWFVNRLWLEPSTFMMKICGRPPLRSLTKAICPPPPRGVIAGVKVGVMVGVSAGGAGVSVGATGVSVGDAGVLVDTTTTAEEVFVASGTVSVGAVVAVGAAPNDLKPPVAK